MWYDVRMIWKRVTSEGWIDFVQESSIQALLGRRADGHVPYSMSERFVIGDRMYATSELYSTSCYAAASPLENRAVKLVLQYAAERGINGTSLARKAIETGTIESIVEAMSFGS